MYCRVPRVGSTDYKQTSAAGHTRRTPKPITKLTISDLRLTTSKCSSIWIANVSSPPLCREKSVEAWRSIGLHWSYCIVGSDYTYVPTSRYRCPKPAGERDIIDAAPVSLGGRNPEEQRRDSPGGRNPRDERRPSPAGERVNIDSAPASLGGRNPEERQRASPGGRNPGDNKEKRKQRKNMKHESNPRPHW